MKNTDQFNKKVGELSYWFVFINVFLAGIVLIYFNDAIRFFLREDSIAESSGAFFLFLTGVFLFICFYICRKNIGNGEHQAYTKINTILFLLASVAFFWAAGEEISWGQRIFDFHTPSYLSEINQQNETNLHNLNTSFFNNGLESICLLFILVSTILYVKNIRRVLGIVAPSLHLILIFQLTNGFIVYNAFSAQDSIPFIALLVFIYIFIKQKNWRNLVFVLLNVFLTIFIAYMNITGRELFPNNGPREFREYLFSFACLLYAFQMYRDLKIPKNS